MEVLLIDDLVLLGVRTTCLGTEDPCNYRHSLLLDARHKNVYNSCPLKNEVVNLFMSGEMRYHEDPKFFRAGRRPVIRYNTMHYLHNIFMI